MPTAFPDLQSLQPTNQFQKHAVVACYHHHHKSHRMLSSMAVMLEPGMVQFALGVEEYQDWVCPYAKTHVGGVLDLLCWLVNFVCFVNQS